MRKIIRQSLADTAAERWEAQYRNFTDNKLVITNDLKKLGDSPLPDDVDRFIGNGSWTRLTCHECDKEVDQVIELGQEPDYESYTARICLSCLSKAIDMEKA